MTALGKKIQSTWCLVEWREKKDGVYSVLELEYVLDKGVVIGGCLAADHMTRWVAAEWRGGKKPAKGQKWPVYEAKLLEVGGKPQFVMQQIADYWHSDRPTGTRTPYRTIQRSLRD